MGKVLPDGGVELIGLFWFNDILYPFREFLFAAKTTGHQGVSWSDNS
jgi:hypothetical protein